MLYATDSTLTSYSTLHSARAVALSTFADIFTQAGERVLAQAHVTEADRALVHSVSYALVDALAGALEAQD